MPAARRKTTAWKLDLGAEVRRGGVRFRVWAPSARKVAVVLEGSPSEIPLRAESEGYFSGTAPGAGPGTLYRYRLDKRGPFPDPCSRSQPEGPHGPSQVVDPAVHRWGDAGWKGVELAGQVLYELHVGAFTQEGTLDAAGRELPRLKDLGVTLVELMPVAEFPGRFNWGYDGVGLYAVSRQYGGPESLKRFVDRAHAAGLGVVLDVVYNHLGPDGNYLKQFSPDYFTRRHMTAWGEAPNFDGSRSEHVRRFFIQNACCWLSEFHLDGLRLDATQTIKDDSPIHILAELARAARAAVPRKVVLVAENEAQESRLVGAPERGGYGLDAIWTDDFHHSARVALTGRREAYLADYLGTAQELLSAVKRGFLYQGQRTLWQGGPRGTPVAAEPARAFVFYLQNHDQVSNDLGGERMAALAAPAALRAATALLCLAPETPLLFMGQEWGALQPFLFFADHKDGLAPLVHKGRKEFLAQFPSHAGAEAQALVPDPREVSTFLKCKLDRPDTDSPCYRLHRDLLELRRSDPVLSAQDRLRMDGAVLGEGAFVLRFFPDGGDERVLLLNLGRTLDLSPASEPLLAPPAGGAWELLWSSNDVRYGGTGRLSPAREGRWVLEAASAVLLGPGRNR